MNNIGKISVRCFFVRLEVDFLGKIVYKMWCDRGAIPGLYVDLGFGSRR